MHAIQSKQDRERTARCRRIVRAVKETNTKFYDGELSEIEALVERAYGRMKLGKLTLITGVRGP